MIFYSPLSGFAISTYYDLGVAVITNFSLTVVFFIACLYLVLGNVLGEGTLAVKRKATVSATSRIFYNVYSLIYETVYTTLGDKEKSYAGTIFTLFLTIYIANALGLVPYSFTLTSHMIVAFSFSVPVFIAQTFTAIYRHKTGFFSLFLPAGAPIAIIPLLTMIELISYIARVFSLAIRLAANLIAGHVILKIIASASAGLFVGGVAHPIMLISSVFPLLILTVFYVLEFAVAALQAYVFAILTTNYLSDAISIGH